MEETRSFREENGYQQKTKQEQEQEQEQDEEEIAAGINIWKYVFGFTEMAVVKCAIELGIADELEKNGGSMTLSELSSVLGCPSSSLYRIMRFLAYRGFFKPIRSAADQTSKMFDSLSYSQTPLSRKLLKKRFDNMAAFILLESSPVMLAPWLKLSSWVLGKSHSAFEAANGQDVWCYAADHLSHSKLFNDAMACDARVAVPQIIKACPGLFDGVTSIVDVGGGDATTLSLLVDAFPWLKGINFDLPHVVAQALSIPERVEHVGGNMFKSVPKADIAFLKLVLHDWGDDECVEILIKCKEAIAKDKGKVIIVEAVIGDHDQDQDQTTHHHDHDHKLQDVGLMFDMAMMAHTTHGKERTLNEWEHVLKLAGFSHFNVYPLQTVQSVIEAFP